MIASVRGTVLARATDSVVVEVGGVGLRVQCTPRTASDLREGADVRLATSMVVREDSLTLYGFPDEDERVLFELLQSATGVGPRLALAVLATLAADDVRRAIATGDTATLTKVPGVGRKGAERLVVELSDRLGPWREAAPAPRSPVTRPGDGAREAVLPRGPLPWQVTVSEALMGLGWSAASAEVVVRALEDERAVPTGGVAQAEASVDLADLVRRAVTMAGGMR